MQIPKPRFGYLPAAITFLMSFFTPFGLQAQTHKVEVIQACGFSNDVRNEYDCTDDPVAGLEDMVFRMLAFDGVTGTGIHVEDCKGINNPVTTRNKDGSLSIIVNAQKIVKADRWSVTAMLAHELGHIYDRHIFGAACVTRNNELEADYYAGLWARRAKCPYVDLVIAPYRTVLADATHPDSSDRIQKVREGWANAEKPYLTAPVDTSLEPVSDAERYKSYAGVYVTVTPYILRTFPFKKHNDYRVKIHLTSKDIRLPVDSIISHILKVSYSFDEDHIKEKLEVSYNQYNDNYGYMITGVWNEFPVKCVIYFKDDSILPIVQRYQLNLKK